VLASVCHHTIAWTFIAIGPYPRTDPTTPLCCSCLEFNKLMANLTYHYCEFKLMKEYHRLEIKIIRPFQVPQRRRRARPPSQGYT
jgi:hypothetical protein